MNRQSCMVVERGGPAPVRITGDSLCWGRRVTFQVHRWAGICQDRWVHLARQYIALPRPWLPLRMESSVSKDFRPQVTKMCGPSGSSTLVYVSGPVLCGGGGGGLAGRKGVGAVDHTGVG